MAFTAGLTGGLTEPITKTLLEDYFYGGLTLEELVALLGSTLWLDATETYAKSKVAVDLDGANDYFSNSDDNFNLTSDFTLSAWVNLDSLIGGEEMVLMKGSGASNNIQYGMRVSNGQLQLILSDAGNYWGYYKVGTTIPSASAWHHVAIAVTLGSQAEFFLNGVSDGTVAISETSIHTSNIDFVVGRANKSINTYFTGLLDQVQVFNKALSSTEVNYICDPLGDNSNLGLNHKDLDGTETFYNNIVAWYDFNVPNDFGKNYEGTSALDLTPVSITSANATLGHIEGKAAGYDGVTRWLDRSGNGNDVSQSTLADCPYFDAATNSIIFTGTQNLVTSGNIGLTGDFTIFEVKAYSDVTEVVDTVGINGNLIRNIGSGSERNVWSATPNNNSTSLVNNTFAITAQNLEDGVSGNFWTNGVKDDAFSDTTMVRTDGPLKINQDTGIVGELRYKAVLYWNRKLTDSEMATVFKYLNDLYGVY